MIKQWFRADIGGWRGLIYATEQNAYGAAVRRCQQEGGSLLDEKNNHYSIEVRPARWIDLHG